MQPGALLGGLAGAALGAFGWALITYFTGYEVGYVAWAVGGLVGFGVVRLGGRGNTMAMAAAVLALLAILGGKMLAVRMGAPEELRKDPKFASQSDYDEQQKDARDFSSLKGEEDYRSFMVSHKYTEAEKAADISDDEVRFFTEKAVPLLRDFHESTPNYEDWREERLEGVAGMLNDPKLLLEAVQSDLGLFDLLFAALGIGTAFKLVAAAGGVSGRPEGQTPAAPEGDRLA